MKRRPQRRAAALVVALLTLMVVMLITGAVLQSLLAYRRQSLVAENQLQSEWLAEAAIDRAQARLAGDPAYRGERWEITLKTTGSTPATAITNIGIQALDGDSKRHQITVTATYPADSIRAATTQRSYTVAP